MSRPDSHPALPFDDPASDDDTPLTVTIRVAQPSLLGGRVGLETDVVHAIEACAWPAAREGLAGIRHGATDAHAAAMDAALPVLDALASMDGAGVDDVMPVLREVVGRASSNVWLRHVSDSLVSFVIERDATAGLGARLPVETLPAVYRVLLMSTRPGLGVVAARALLRDALVLGLPVSIAALDDRALDVLEASDLPRWWYSVLGAFARLWPVPKRRPDEADVRAVLDAPVPDDDEARARLFWQCYRVWKAQTTRHDVVAHTRARMKQLHPELFARLA